MGSVQRLSQLRSSLADTDADNRQNDNSRLKLKQTFDSKDVLGTKHIMSLEKTIAANVN